MGCSLFSNSHFQMGVTVMGLQSTLGLEYYSTNENFFGAFQGPW